MKKKILMFVSNDVYNDPRVQKEAKSLASAGYEVVVFGQWQKRGKPRERIDGYTIYRHTHYQGFKLFYEMNIKNNIRKIYLYQLLNKFERKLTKKIKAKNEVSTNSSAENIADVEKDKEEMDKIKKLNEIFYNYALKYKPDICHCHDLDTLYAGYLLKQKIGCKLIYDAHELFTEQPFTRSKQWIDYYNNLELEIIPLIDKIITVNPSLAREYKKYNVNNAIFIYNCSLYEKSVSAEDLRKIAKNRKIVLFHGGLIKDRGLEQLILSAKFLKDILIVIRGYGLLETKLRELVKQECLEDKIYFAKPVKSNEMVKFAVDADIGIIPILPTCLNNLLCTPIKLFEYMMAGLAIIGSNLPELKRIILEENIGLIIDNPYNPEEIADKINQLASDDKKLQEFKNNSLKAAQNKYNWEIEEKKLLNLYEDILGN